MIAVFVYDFPHRKSSDGLLFLKVAGYECIVFAQPFKKLNVSDSGKSWGIKDLKAFHPKDVAKVCGFKYLSIDHDNWAGIQTQSMTWGVPNLTIGVIFGARILKKPVIDLFSTGIINGHTAKLPECRGLAAPKWAVLRNIPQMVTFHLIDENIDEGRLLYYHKVPVHAGDTPEAVNQRSLSVQVYGTITAIEIAKVSPKGLLPKLEGNDYDWGISEVADEKVRKLWKSYIERFAE